MYSKKSNVGSLSFALGMETFMELSVIMETIQSNHIILLLG